MTAVPNTLPKNYKIVEISKKSQTKFVLKRKRLWFWSIVTKLGLEIDKPSHSHTESWVNYEVSDRKKNRYIFTWSDGNCRTYEEALEFFFYVPEKEYMRSDYKEDVRVVEVWANNEVACDFIGLAKPSKNKSRIGLFLDVTEKNSLEYDVLFGENCESWKAILKKEMQHF